ncbi:hypothetical protein EDC94DRAFT_635583 [Helicostylum pulchrum]|nr:hypothetical protein EDC94DRAFT_635583 [Helicostylum pulchrum]
MTFVAIQIITSIIILFISWEMYCDKPLRVFVTVYIVRLVLTAPISIYTHLTPHRRSTSNVSSPRSSARLELSEAYAMSERNRPLSFPPPVMPTNHRQNYPAFITPVQEPTPTLNTPPQFDENAMRAWVDSYTTHAPTTSNTKNDTINNISPPPESSVDHITIDLSKPNPPKPVAFDKLWLYLGLIDPPCETEPEYDILEIPDTQDQVQAPFS